MNQSEHWNKVYDAKAFGDVSWYQPSATVSRRLIQEFAPELDARIVDVGAGSSPLAGELIERGYRNVTALDFAATALAQGRTRAGDTAGAVDWIVADVTEPREWPQQVELWHDRAVFHFLQTRDERRGYIANAYRAIKDDGYLVIAAFSPDGPPK
jgi:SAM-dependent methyltransferase